MIRHRGYRLLLGFWGLFGLATLTALPTPGASHAQDADGEEEPPPQAADDWPLVAYRQVRRSGRVVLHVAEGDGHRARVRFQAQGRALVIVSVRLEFAGDVEPISLRPRERIRPARSGETIELPGGAVLQVVRVTLRLGGGRGPATLNLLGEPHE